MACRGGCLLPDALPGARVGPEGAPPVSALGTNGCVITDIDEADYAAHSAPGHINLNTDELPDQCDGASDSSDDCNTNLGPDERAIDCNTHSIPDDCDNAAGTSQIWTARAFLMSATTYSACRTST